MIAVEIKGLARVFFKEGVTMGLFERLVRLNQEKRNQPPSAPLETDPRPVVPASILSGQEIKAALGSFCLRRQYFDLDWPLTCCPNLIHRNLQLVRGIGPVTEARLKAVGMDNVSQLTAHPRFGPDACQVQNLIAIRNIKELKRRGASDLELMGLFSVSEALFLDIETTGLWSSQPLFLVGTMGTQGPKMVLDQLLARHYREERALLVHLAGILKRTELLITFNGKRFDWPYITDRMLYYRIPRPREMLQVDLYEHARRLPQDLPNRRLTTLEQYLLGFHRQGDIPGYQVPAVYHQFVQTQKPHLLAPILDHNEQDVISLVRLLSLIAISPPP
jgi:uncharacterized protein YprB with RNaseH-like and TPR domain